MKRTPDCQLSLVLLGLSFLLTACGADSLSSQETCQGDSCGGLESAAGRPAGWTEQTHGKEAAPDYDVVFPQGKVNRLDITISAEDWQAVLDDLSQKMGPFGDSRQSGEPPQDQPQPSQEGEAPAAPEGSTPQAGAQGQGPPPELFEACEGKAADEACSVVLDGKALESRCAELMGQLACLPDDNSGEPRPDGGTAGQPQGMPTAQDNPIFVPCTLSFEGKAWGHVGIRAKGNSSLMSSWRGGSLKLPLRLDLDEFEDQHPEIEDQRFFGFKKLSLNNGFTDDSLVREKVMNDLLRAAGVPAARAAFYRVYIDHGDGPLFFGLYTMVEVPDDPMFESQLSGGGGNLYKPDGAGADWTRFDQGGFPKKSNEEEGDFSDIEGAIAALNASRQDAGAWRAGLEARVDVGGFLKWLAVNTLVQNWDCYGVYAHNYYLYTDPGSGLIRWIPWDNNEAFMETRTTLSLTLQEVDEHWPLIRFLLDDPVYKAEYYASLEAFLAGPFAPGSVEDQLTAEHSLITPYVVGDEGEVGGYTLIQDPARFSSALDKLLSHVSGRRVAAAEVLSRR